jgi:hypothetical protein
MSVIDGCDWFNHTSISDVLASWGITYTMADKEAKSIPYIDISECSFLKRSWRYEKELDFFVCPLDEDSIIKSLMVIVKSKIPIKKQLCEIICSANAEYFFYGKEKFHQQQDLFKNIIDQFDLGNYVHEMTLASWETLKERFLKASK